MSEITPAELAALRKTIPPMPNVSDEQFAEEMRKTHTNVSVRPSKAASAKLIYLHLMHGRSKAGVVKIALDLSIEQAYKKIMQDGQYMMKHQG